MKRSTDSRIRREVVGQMLDYAANAVAYWPVEEVRARFEARCGEDGLDAGAVLSGFLGDGQDASAFWQQVKTNLQAGRVRLIFIADEIPPELRRVVEFLTARWTLPRCSPSRSSSSWARPSRRSSPASWVLTETARQKKSADRGEKRHWDEATFFNALRERSGDPEAALALSLLEWARKMGLRIWWGEGKNDGSFFAMYDNRAGKSPLFSVWTYGTIELQFQRMNLPPFTEAEKRRELATRLRVIPRGIDPRWFSQQRPSFKLRVLTDKGCLTSFLETFDWVLGEIKKAEPPPVLPESSSSPVSDHGALA